MGKSEYLASLAARMAVWRAVLEGAETSRTEEIRRLYGLVCRLMMEYQRRGAEGWREERGLLDDLTVRLDELTASSAAASGARHGPAKI
jgi:hypothetical protein